jgi:hypothetical protein
MAAQLGFDSASIGGTPIAKTAFVRGGTYSPEPNNSEVFTSDGKFHGIPLYRGGTASFKMYGDGLSHTTAAADAGSGGVGVTCILTAGSQTIISATALVTCSYDEAERSTTIELKFDPTVDA